METTLMDGSTHKASTWDPNQRKWSTHTHTHTQLGKQVFSNNVTRYTVSGLCTFNLRIDLRRGVRLPSTVFSNLRGIAASPAFTETAQRHLMADTEALRCAKTMKNHQKNVLDTQRQLSPTSCKDLQIPVHIKLHSAKKKQKYARTEST